MKVYYCQKEFDKAVEYLYYEHKDGLFSKSQLRSILKDLLKEANRTDYTGTAGFSVNFTELVDGYEYYADITVTPYLSYQDQEDFTTYLEV